MDKDLLKELCDMSISLLEQIWKVIKENKLENSQDILDFLDKLNEYSIRN